jgi:diguanylate cyclase (GGDEF)-like protein
MNSDRVSDTTLVPTIDLIIADILSEIEDRYSFAKLRDLPAFKGVPILMTGDNSMSEAMQVAFALGATDFVSKPLRQFELLTRSRSALRLRQEIMRRKSRESELLEVTRQLSELNTMLTRLSYVDGLTGVSNRRFFDRALEQEWKRAARCKGSISLILLDVDYFKKYNDTYGHLSGDDCLQEVASAIKNALKRPGDVLARVGGEEFGIVLPETPAEGAMHVGECVRKAVESLQMEHHESEAAQVVTVSVGVSTATPSHSSRFETICASADKALYAAKSAGRNRVQFLDWNESEEPMKAG